jgi:hypothetical protein
MPQFAAVLGSGPCTSRLLPPVHVRLNLRPLLDQSGRSEMTGMSGKRASRSPPVSTTDIRIVTDIDADLAVFAQTQHWTRNPIVIRKRINHLSGAPARAQRCDPKRIVRCGRDLGVSPSQCTP